MILLCRPAQPEQAITPGLLRLHSRRPASEHQPAKIVLGIVVTATGGKLVPGE
jgi:hypothetical protein